MITFTKRCQRAYHSYHLSHDAYPSPNVLCANTEFCKYWICAQSSRCSWKEDGCSLVYVMSINQVNSSYYVKWIFIKTLWLEIISTQERVSWRAQLMETLFLVIFLCKNTKEDYIRLLQKMKKKCLHWCSLFNENVIVVKLKLNLSWFGVEFDVWWFIRAMYVFYPCMILSLFVFLLAVGHLRIWMAMDTMTGYI